MPNSNCQSLDLSQLLSRAERPFPSCPQVSRYFPASAIETARKRLSRTIERGDGPGLIVGAAGTGKSLLLQVLAAQYHQQFDVVLLACARICTRRALLQAILFELGLPYRSRDEGELRLGLLDQLLAGDPESSGLLLLVDEAQSLSTTLLEELRVLTNVTHAGVPRVRLVLAGSMRLEESFANPELESFSQRLATRAYLAPFNRLETAQFVRAQIAASQGAPDQIFTQDSYDSIFDATDGLPRLVNQLCDRALWLADSEGRANVDSQVVQAAWSDLQQLPTTWTTVEADSTAQDSVPSAAIEFGPLDEGAFVESPTKVASPREEVIPATEEGALDPHDPRPEVEDECDFIPRKHPLTEKSAQEATSSRTSPSMSENPFSDDFEEEELVLDNFAAWGEMINQRTPRVENRRDSGFASRVRDAMNTVEQTTTTTEVKNRQSTGRLSHEEEPSGVESATGTEYESSSSEPASDVNTIRLAIVADPPRLTPIPLVAPPDGIATTGAAAFDPVMPESDQDDTLGDDGVSPRSLRHDHWTGHVVAEDCEPDNLSSTISKKPDPPVATFPMVVEEPVLVIEPDGPEQRPAPGPIRRESYRNLFSRLRSG